MKTLLFAPETINIAETIRMIEIARRCRDTFHCVFFGYADTYAHLITAAGFPFHALEPQLTPAQIDHLWRVDRLESMADPFPAPVLRRRVESEIALYRELQPAAVVIGFTLSTLLSTRAAGVPLVYVMPFPLTRPFLEADLATWPDAFDWPPLRLVPRRVLDHAANAWMRRTRLWVRPFGVVARKYKLSPPQRLLDLYEGDENLVTDIPELTGVLLPPHWHYVGPIFAHLDGAIPGEIQALSQQHPLIYCAMGSSANREILATVLTAFTGSPYTVITPMRTHLAHMKLTIPPNVHVFDWLPAHLVNPLADIAVIHGGQGTVQTAVAAGTPFVGIGLQPEQEANIDLIVRHGSALRIRKRQLTRARLLEAIQTLLDNAAARDAAQKLRAVSEQWQGAENAAEFLRRTYGSAAG